MKYEVPRRFGKRTRSVFIAPGALALMKPRFTIRSLREY